MKFRKGNLVTINAGMAEDGKLGIVNSVSQENVCVDFGNSLAIVPQSKATLAKRIPLGTRVSLSPECGAAGVLGSVPDRGTIMGKVVENNRQSPCDYTHRVRWDGGSNDIYAPEDLCVLSHVFFERHYSEPKQKSLTRVIFTDSLFRANKPDGDCHIACVEDLGNLPEQVQTATHCRASGVEAMFSMPFDSFAKSFKPMTWRYMYIRISKDVYACIDLKHRQKLRQYDKSKVYRVTKLHYCETMDIGDYVKVIIQEPEDFTGTLAYRIQKINTEKEEWVGCEMGFEEV